MPLPNLIIAGPPKSGTTSLFEWLSEHPDALPSTIKETDYFNENVPENSSLKHFRKDGWEGYETLFPGWKKEKIVFEASPKYVYSSSAPEYLSTLKDIKIIFIHREPSERLYSEFKFHKYKTKLYSESFKEYLIHKNIQLDKPIKNENELSYYINTWLKYFKPHQLLIVDFTQLKSEPKEVMRKVCKFLKIDALFFDDFEFKKENETYGIKSKKLHYFLLQFHGLVPRKIRKIATRFYLSFNKAKIPSRTETENLILSELKKYYEDSEYRFKSGFKKIIR